MCVRHISLQVSEQLSRDLKQIAERDRNGLSASCRRLLSTVVGVEF